MQDILSRFNGSWALRPIKSEDGARVVGTDAVLEQDILPAGQAFISHPCSPPLHRQHHPPVLCRGATSFFACARKQGSTGSQAEMSSGCGGLPEQARRPS